MQMHSPIDSGAWPQCANRAWGHWERTLFLRAQTSLEVLFVVYNPDVGLLCKVRMVGRLSVTSNIHIRPRDMHAHACCQ